MSKEHLRKLKKRTQIHEHPEKGSTAEMPREDMEYLLGQAERAERLEENLAQCKQMKYHEAYEQGKFDTNMKIWYEVPKLEKQNNIYRKAIYKAIDEVHEGYYPEWIIANLNKALEESEEYL